MKELVGEKPFSENALKVRITAGVVYPSFVFPEHYHLNEAGRQTRPVCAARNRVLGRRK